MTAPQCDPCAWGAHDSCLGTVYAPDSDEAALCGCWNMKPAPHGGVEKTIWDHRSRSKSPFRISRRKGKRR